MRGQGGPNYTVPDLLLRGALAVHGAANPGIAHALRTVGLAGDLPCRPCRIRLDQEVMFFEEAARAFDDPLFGLRTGLAFEPRGTNLLSYILFAASNLRQAMTAAARFSPLERPSIDLQVDRTKAREARVRIDSHDAHERRMVQSTECYTATVLLYLRAATKVDFPLERATFAHQRGEERREAAEALLGCTVVYGDDSTALYFPERVLDLPIPSQDDNLCEILLTHGELLLRERGAQRPGLVTKVERLVLDSLPRGGPQAAKVAAKLGMSERTLARRLGEHGLSLRGIVEELRRELAVSYLGDPGLSLGQISYLLGYSEPSAFSAAFRRWTGRPPGRFREETEAKARTSPRSTGRGGGPEEAPR